MVLKYAYIFKLSAPKTASVDTVEWSYFAQKCNTFQLQPFRFEKFSRVETPGPLLTGRGKLRKGRITVFLPLKGERKHRRGARWRGRRRGKQQLQGNLRP